MNIERERETQSHPVIANRGNGRCKYECRSMHRELRGQIIVPLPLQVLVPYA